MIPKECQFKKQVFKGKLISVNISKDNFAARNEQKYAFIYQKCKIIVIKEIQKCFGTEM